jgi:hypothetical protein
LVGSLIVLILVGLGGVVGVGLVVLFLALRYSEDAERVAGWITTLIAKVYKKVDRSAVAFTVQGNVNKARSELLKSVPPELMEKKLKVKWADVDEAEAHLKEGEVLVVMRRSDHHEENVAHAVMAYLPKSMLPRARRYLDKERMRAADLVVAKGLLARIDKRPGSLAVFYEDHMDPARAQSDDLKAKIDELDEVDLQGWLLRLLLAEYLRLGDDLHPGEPDKDCHRDAEEFARWLHGIASRSPGDESRSLSFEGRHFRVAVIFVGIKDRLIAEGLVPYRKRAKRYIYQDRFDAIYLMARDDNIEAVEALVENLESDGRVSSVSKYTYALRDDFRSRHGLDRERAIIACLRRRKAAEVPPELEPEGQLEISTEDDLEALPEERFQLPGSGGSTKDEQVAPTAVGADGPKEG